MLDNGNIVLYDNGYSRGYTRVLEIDPVTHDIVWEYQGSPPESFFSATLGSVQRLPNGNTLIAESVRGRLIEVTPDREIVWEYWNPSWQDGYREVIKRVERLPAAYVDPMLNRN